MFIALAAAVMVPVMLILKFLGGINIKAQKLYLRLYYGFFWNHTVVFGLESYISVVLVLTEIIYFKKIVFRSPLLAVMSIVYITSSLIYLVAPAFLTIYLRKKFGKFRSRYFKQRFGAFT